MQALFTPDRTTKRRFDASAEGKNGKSLNDHLEKGPNYINSFPNVLMAWRFEQVAYTGNMRKMFNQVRIHPDDQVFHRFYNDNDDNNNNNNNSNNNNNIYIVPILSSAKRFTMLQKSLVKK